MSASRVNARVRALRPSETLALSARARELRARGEKVVSFAAGEPDFETPASIQNAAIEAIRGGHHRYTEVAGTLALRTAIAEKLRRDSGVTYGPKEIVVGNGAKHAIWNALFTVLEPGDEVLCPVPYWVSFPEMVRLAGGMPVAVPPAPGRYKITVEDVERVRTPRTRLLILNSPNNPSGMVYTRDEVAALVELARRHDLLILSDEIYEKLIYGDARHTSPASLGEEARSRTIVINGVSKTWAMTGWRIGYAANTKLAPVFTRWVTNTDSCAPHPNQWAVVTALNADQGPSDHMRDVFLTRRDHIVAGLNRIPGFRCQTPGGAFYVWPNVTDACKRVGAGSSEELRKRLLHDAGVAVLADVHFGTPVEGEGQHIRFSYASSLPAIDEGLSRIAEFMKKNTR